MSKMSSTLGEHGLSWYRTSMQNLGLRSLIRLQWQKKFSTTDKMVLTSKALAHPVIARKNTSDLAVFHQILVEREYECLDRVRDASLIVDCGANVGYSSAYFLSRYPRAKVIAIEPDPENFAALEANLAPYGSRCRIIEAAIWSRPEPLRLKKSSTAGEEWASSVEPGITQNAATVQAITIPALFNGTPFRRISILKIDIEGAELELLDDDTSWLDLADNIVIELHSDEARQKFLKEAAARAFHISNNRELTCCIGKMAYRNGGVAIPA
jgi:FkbM family methyltransferase